MNNIETLPPTEQRIQVAHVDWTEQSDLQMRDGGLDANFIEGLVEYLIENPDKDLPPIVVFADEETPDLYHVGDGWHRLQSYRARPSRKTMPALVYQGGKKAAWHYALRANADQTAKPRTRGDLRKAVRAAIDHYKEDLEAGRMTQQRIAEMCKTSQKTVSRIWHQYYTIPQERKDQRALVRGEGPYQLSFFDQWAADWRPILTYIDRIPKIASALLDDNVSLNDRIEACRAMRETLRCREQELKDIEGSLLSHIPADSRPALRR